MTNDQIRNYATHVDRCLIDSLHAKYIQNNKWIGYVGLGIILIVAIQLIIGGLGDIGVLSINETFKKYF